MAKNDASVMNELMFSNFHSSCLHEICAINTQLIELSWLKVKSFLWKLDLSIYILQRVPYMLYSKHHSNPQNVGKYVTNWWTKVYVISKHCEHMSTFSYYRPLFSLHCTLSWYIEVQCNLLTLMFALNIIMFQVQIVLEKNNLVLLLFWLDAYILQDVRLKWWINSE